MLAQPRGGSRQRHRGRFAVVLRRCNTRCATCGDSAPTPGSSSRRSCSALIAILGTLVTRRGWVVDRIGRLWSRGIVRVCGIDLEVEGLEHLQPGQSYILICNHLSNFDIWCTLASMPFAVRFVAKKELLRFPVFGQALARQRPHRHRPRRTRRPPSHRINAAAATDRTGHGHPLLRRGHAQPRRQGARVQEGRRQPRPAHAVADRADERQRHAQVPAPRLCRRSAPAGACASSSPIPIPTAGLSYRRRATRSTSACAAWWCATSSKSWSDTDHAWIPPPRRPPPRRRRSRSTASASASAARPRSRRDLTPSAPARRSCCSAQRRRQDDAPAPVRDAAAPERAARVRVCGLDAGGHGTAVRRQHRRARARELPLPRPQRSPRTCSSTRASTASPTRARRSSS